MQPTFSPYINSLSTKRNIKTTLFIFLEKIFHTVNKISSSLVMSLWNMWCEHMNNLHISCMLSNSFLSCRVFFSLGDRTSFSGHKTNENVTNIFLKVDLCKKKWVSAFKYLHKIKLFLWGKYDKTFRCSCITHQEFFFHLV